MPIATSAVHNCVPLTNLIRVLEAVHVGHVMVQDIIVICHDVFIRHIGTPRLNFSWRFVRANKHFENETDRHVDVLDSYKRRSVGSKDPTHRCLVAPHVHLRLA